MNDLQNILKEEVLSVSEQPSTASGLVKGSITAGTPFRPPSVSIIEQQQTGAQLAAAAAAAAAASTSSTPQPAVSNSPKIINTLIRWPCDLMFPYYLFSLCFRWFRFCELERQKLPLSSNICTDFSRYKNVWVS